MELLIPLAVTFGVVLLMSLALSRMGAAAAREANRDEGAQSQTESPQGGFVADGCSPPDAGQLLGELFSPLLAWWRSRVKKPQKSIPPAWWLDVLIWRDDAMDWWRSIPLRRRIVFVGLVVGFLLMMLPPWVEVYPSHGIRIEEGVGYGFIAWPPTPEGTRSVQIDYGRLFLSLAAVAGLTAATCVLVNDQRKQG